MQTFCRLDEQGKELMRAAVRRMELSALWYHRVLKLARTIAEGRARRRRRRRIWPRRCSTGRGGWCSAAILSQLGLNMIDTIRGRTTTA